LGAVLTRYEKQVANRPAIESLNGVAIAISARRMRTPDAPSAVIGDISTDSPQHLLVRAKRFAQPSPAEIRRTRDTKSTSALPTGSRMRQLLRWRWRQRNHP
jgi:hypothetical protein